MSALGQRQTCAAQKGMSALPPKSGRKSGLAQKAIPLHRFLNRDREWQRGCARKEGSYCGKLFSTAEIWLIGGEFRRHFKGQIPSTGPAVRNLTWSANF